MDIEELLDKKRKELETLRQTVSMLKIQLCAVQIGARALNAVDNTVNVPRSAVDRRRGCPNPDRR